MMFFSDKIMLRSEKITKDDKDEYGDPIISYTDTEVWANKKSIKRAEFYAASTSGIDLTIAFEVHAEDYNGQKSILYNGKPYDVVRTYQKGEGIVELNCSDKAV